MSETVLITKADLTEDMTRLLVVLHMEGVMTMRLESVAAAFGIEWAEVLVRAGKMIEEGSGI